MGKHPVLGILVLATLSFGLPAAGVAASAGARAVAPSCLGKKATIVGTGKSETLRGTSHADVIVGMAGGDEIYGGAGTDRICGGDNNDVLFGGAGRDIISGGPGNDRSTGGPAGDREFGDAGADLFLQGSLPDGGDTLVGGSGPDTTSYALRSSTAGGRAGAAAGAVTVSLDGEASDGANCGDESDNVDTETVVGTPGADDLLGDSSASVLRAGGGADALIGGPGDDTLLGGAGNDSFATGGGADTTDALGPESTCDGPLSGCDLTAPSLLSLSVDPPQVDTSTGPKTITVTVRFSDELSGLRYVNGWSGWPEDARSHAVGTVLDCTIELQRVIPQWSPQGVFSLGDIGADDRAGNTHYWSPEDLAGLGYPTTWEQTGEGDTTPPTVHSFSFTPTQVDTSEAARKITVRAHVSDDLSGVHLWDVSFRSESNRVVSENFNQFDLISGDATNGTYEGVLTVPRYSEHGTWTLDSLYAVDEVQNEMSLDGPALTALGAAPSFFQQGAGDITAPHLESFAFSPTTINTTSAYQTITVRARVTDGLSGVDQLQADFVSPSGQTVSFYAEQNPEFCTPTNWQCGGLESGTYHDGVYAQPMRVPRFAELGDWTVTFFFLADRARNEQQLSGEDLAGLGFPITFHNGP
jgi:hypothetical protein